MLGEVLVYLSLSRLNQPNKEIWTQRISPLSLNEIKGKRHKRPSQNKGDFQGASHPAEFSTFSLLNSVPHYNLKLLSHFSWWCFHSVEMWVWGGSKGFLHEKSPCHRKCVRDYCTESSLFHSSPSLNLSVLCALDLRCLCGKIICGKCFSVRLWHLEHHHLNHPI